MKAAMRTLLVGLAVFATAPGHATQVRHLTVGGGYGSPSAASHGAVLLLGEPIAGTAAAPAGGADLGLMVVLHRTSAVSPVPEDLPGLGAVLGRPWPNPFNPALSVSFTLERETEVRLEAFDMRGRRVATLVRGVRPAGVNVVTWEPRGLASGAYLILMRADGCEASRRVMLVK